MYKLFIIISALLLVSCEDVTFYIVRHAEKETATMAGDPALSAEGEKQAMDLMYMLQGSKVKHVFSTNYARTMSTAEPTRKQFGVDVQVYDPNKMAQFIDQLKAIKDGDVLVVGHSNTVDDVVNGLLGEKKMSDLPDSEYGMVYKVKRTGSSFSLEVFSLPKATPRQ